MSENLEIISHLHSTVFKALKSEEIPPQAYKAHNIAKKNLVYCYSSQLGAYKNKDSNLSKLIEAQRELIGLGRLPCPTCSDIVVEVTEDEDLLAEVQAIERAYAEKGRGSCEDEDHACALGGIVLALQSAALSEDALLLCDNEAVLCVIKKWVRQGGKATLATAPDADILQEMVCLLTQRVRAGRTTFLIKVKSIVENQSTSELTP